VTLAWVDMPPWQPPHWVGKKVEPKLLQVSVQVPPSPVVGVMKLWVPPPQEKSRARRRSHGGRRITDGGFR
jgi:hypothetical protein